MGAQRDFVKAKTMAPTTAMCIGAVVGAAITIAIFQLRGGHGDLSAAEPASGSQAPSAMIDPRDAELARLRARVTQLERAGSSAAMPATSEPDGDRGMSTSDAWWAKLAPDPAWDVARRQKVIDRLAKIGVALDPEQVECKRRCCRLALTDELYDEHLSDITSSIGLDFEPPDGLGTAKAGDVYMVTKCWSTRRAPPMPDRLVEREALLAKASDAVRACAQDVSPAITLKLSLEIDLDGQIAKVESNAKQLGQKAATCAEGALLQAASFASSPAPSRVPIVVVLGK